MDKEKHNSERIAKRIARAGICSRRDAERLIADGRVRVNGKVISSPALTVTPEDTVSVDNQEIKIAEKSRLFLYHKPAGLITTHKDERGRTTVFDKMPKELGRVISVGRLDLNTEGLLLLTNDGELARYLELPKNAWSRKYRVRVHGFVDDKKLENLKNGLTVEGVRYQSIIALRDKTPEEKTSTGTNTWLSITLQEGKNREVRKVMEHIGLKVTRLIRTDYGPFSLGKLPKGGIIEIKPHILKDQIKGYFNKKDSV